MESLFTDLAALRFVWVFLQKNHLKKTEIICPRCRQAGAGKMIQHALELGDVFKEENGFILEGFLICSNAQCRFRHPIVQGVPILMKNLEGWLESEETTSAFVAGDTAGMQKYLYRLQQNGAQAEAERSLLSTYMDFHYGSPDDVPDPLAPYTDPKALWQRLVETALPEGEKKYNLSLDLGCSVGRYTFELARFSALAVGVDMHFQKVAAAARLQRTRRVSYQRKMHGRCYENVESSFLPVQNALFLAADALDPPFRAETFDLVAGLNLLDNVRLPLVLIGQMDALLKKGGTMVMSSPYEWRADICEPSQWLESQDMAGPAAVRKLLEGAILPEMGLTYEVVEDRENVPWMLRHHDRHWSLFLLHLLKAGKKQGRP